MAGRRNGGPFSSLISGRSWNPVHFGKGLKESTCKLFLLTQVLLLDFLHEPGLDDVGVKDNGLEKFLRGLWPSL